MSPEEKKEALHKRDMHDVQLLGYVTPSNLNQAKKYPNEHRDTKKGKKGKEERVKSEGDEDAVKESNDGDEDVKTLTKNKEKRA